ncbi:MAG TPA: cytidylate kinase-like family protein [Clostridiales bacterium]|nr:cytidylate kinase-like family protein [Clostridiales bacterium]
MSNFVITIARGYGSGGRTVGKMLAERLNISYHDKDLINLASEESGIHVSLFGKVDEQPPSRIFRKKNIYRGELFHPESDEFVSEDNLFNYQAKIIKDIASNSSCVIVGRCADYILKDYPNLIRLFIYADLETCIKNVVDMYSISPEEARKRIKKIDKERSSYYRYHTGHDWNNAYNYDLCLNTSRMDFETCVEIILSYIRIKLGNINAG